MTKEQIKAALTNLTDSGTASMIAIALIESKDMDAVEGFLRAVLDKCSQGHHQSKEMAICAMRVIRELEAM